MGMRRNVNSYWAPYARCWYDKKWRLHRVGGPAVEHDNGEKHWFIRDKCVIQTDIIKTERT